MNTDYEALEKDLDYKFKDIGLLKLALTHSSYAHEHAKETKGEYNERIEFLGDAVLELINAAGEGGYGLAVDTHVSGGAFGDDDALRIRIGGHLLRRDDAGYLTLLDGPVDMIVGGLNDILCALLAGMRLFRLCLCGCRLLFVRLCRLGGLCIG
jgi:hypothetical protein